MNTWIDKAADKIEARADAEFEELAAVVREKYVIPFCNRHHLRFVSGMGEWIFSEGRGTPGTGELGGQRHAAGLPPDHWQGTQAGPVVGVREIRG